MQPEIKEYSVALEEHLKATQNELTAKDQKRKCYYRLMRAKDALRMRERELLEDIELV